ncbi:protein POLAR-like 1 isoform X2 [Manihot esculenta]|uniref:protein POLAR-like 1 isoform X2 n=1 Tax=Manihot esculenta TaxID=3983 RepID=UPI001CC67882|nr:protein POLAR-like 1 isoform X2 [Manihot esculenta]
MSESECSRSICCPSPHRIVARWISGLRRTRVKRIPDEHVKKEKETESKIDEDEKGLGDRAVQARCSMDGLNGGNSVSTTGESRKDTSFNMGVGCCLLYLIAASKNELNKIVQMRLQMETLLQNTSEELINKSNISKLSKPNDMFAYSDTDSPQGPQFESQYIPESSTISAVDQSLKCEPPEKEKCSEEAMDQLEAELQAELERLQLHLDGEKLKHSELLRVTDEDTTCSKSQTPTSGEVIDLQPHDVDTDCGVPPDELERRLHELLEARQQEEIRELKAAIECLKHKLYEKEVEVSRWKDTAMLISRHAMEPSPLLQNTSEELINKSNISKLSKPNDMFAYSDTDSPQGPQFESQYIPESSTVSAVDQSLKCEPPEKEECSEEAMDQLEAELQAELERLQLHLDGEKLKHSELSRVEVTDEDTTCSKSQTKTSGEVIDLQPHDVDTDCGVPPDELERRLHELLEARQQEEIRELEAAIECLKHKLYEKEVEVSWWKDTAMLISRNAMEPSPFTSRNDPKIITDR